MPDPISPFSQFQKSAAQFQRPQGAMSSGDAQDALKSLQDMVNNGSASNNFSASSRVRCRKARRRTSKSSRIGLGNEITSTEQSAAIDHLSAILWKRRCPELHAARQCLATPRRCHPSVILFPNTKPREVTLLPNIGERQLRRRAPSRKIGVRPRRVH